ncbi:hypothetical protein BDF20DRAFT_886683 [Mycotypha africana]|uniref:uncharacterized protein n=1 Tax=Mycotypha africana TaxID=64632 RepID=UPI002300E9DA|nr:uncharacterized protein BDF20DRAFT_886683 [Mycotypha africana]KAI8971823.1 hypothetical protein BDF20DRAFT_886683 [Mycotypha africana]
MLPDNQANNKRELPERSAKLATFLKDCLTLGTLRGFKHFRTFIRGREELILCVYYQRQTKSMKTVANKNSILLPKSIYLSEVEKSSHTSESVLYAIDSNIPSYAEFGSQIDEVIFLITGYMKYRCPYVWLKSHQLELLKKTTESVCNNGNNPLQLQSTQDWKTKNVSLWEIVAEILKMTTNAKNPFEIDNDVLEKLSLQEAILLSGSLLNFLETVFLELKPAQEELMNLSKLQVANEELP